MQMCHSGVDIFVISRLRISKRQVSSCGLWMFQISTMANFKQNFFNFWSFFTRPGDNDEAGPHVVHAHDSALSLTIF